MIRILHCADLHLDSPFSGIPATLGEERRRGQRELFRSLICTARNRRADLLLIAGDLFDTGYTSTSTLHEVAELLHSLDCPVVIAPGNHDPYREGGIYDTDFPENVHIFKDEALSCFSFGHLNAAVYGYAFRSASLEGSPLSAAPALDPSKINILCAHADTASPLSHYAPITPRELSDSGFIYAALGHIHNAPPAAFYGRTLAAYSGVTEGRGFDETGFGGALWVEIEGDSVTAEKLILAKHRYAVEQIDVTGTTDETGIADRISARISSMSYGKETTLRAVLVGTLDAEFIPDTAVISESIDSVAALDIKDETAPLLSAEAFEGDISIRGEYYRRLVKLMREGSEEERRTAARALKIGLCLFDGKPVVF